MKSRHRTTGPVWCPSPLMTPEGMNQYEPFIFHEKKTENMVRLWMGQRNPASWLLVYLSAGKHPILYRVFYYSRWFRISQPSTVSCHCPSFFTSLYSLRIGGILIPQKNWGVNDSNPQHPNENPNDLNRYSPGKITPSVAQELLLHHQQIDVRLR